MFQDANKLVVFGSQFIAVIIVIAGLLTEQAELRSPRPVGARTQVNAEAHPDGDRFARLWDDPLENLPAFEIVPPGEGPSATPAATPGVEDGSAQNVAQPQRALPKTTPPPAPSPPPRRSAATPAPREQPQTVGKKLLIWNLLDARPIPEVKERRLRTRYAIVSALLTSDYLPLRESLLTRLVDAETATDIGYFETFRAVNKGAELERVTLVWSPKELDVDPHTAFAIEQIATRDHEQAGVTVHILHHGSSEDLANYVRAGKQFAAGGISFTRATIRKEDVCDNVEDCIPRSLRSITADDVLVDALFNELALRIPALNGHPRLLPRIVVFTESDTNYSRGIASELRERFEGKARLQIYSYLRGLDGRPENATPPSAREKEDDAVSALLQGNAISETSFSTSQFDYLRRSALRLQSQAKKGSKDLDVVAVGILGSDIYDKMLVLQAVRPELPGAIAFTTDLDALYLERKNQAFTRNLVVASADALDANESPQAAWQLPPMRDSYQTVLVKQVRALLATPAALPIPAATASPTPQPPRVFEIAGGKSVDLKLPGDPSLRTRAAEYILSRLAKPWLSIFIFCLGLANAFLILKAIFTRKPKEDPDRPEVVRAPMKSWARALIYVEISLAVAAAGWLLLYPFVSGRDALLFGEPLALGVSIWPSVMIRLFAFVVAVLLLLFASKAFVAHGEGVLQKELKAALPNEVALPLPAGLGKESARLCRDAVLETVSRGSDHTYDAHLKMFFDSNARLKRIIVASILYFLLSFLLFRIWPPLIPGRGAFPLLTEKIVLSLGVAIYIIHLIFCLDLHLGAFSLLRALRSFYLPAVQRRIAAMPGARIDAKGVLRATSGLTAMIGKTLLYPLTVLILIILSRLRIFDNWNMTPSLTITFSAGAVALVVAALTLWLEGSRLRKVVLAAHPEEAKELSEINEGVFAPWHHQPIFAAIFSAAAVFGSLTVAGPVARMFFGYS